MGELFVELEEELVKKRSSFKSTGFGILYGIGGPKLSNQLTREGSRLITEEEAWDRAMEIITRPLYRTSWVREICKKDEALKDG